jgi:UDPglucose--hexose-1-phosphate uridylyltransferase
MNEMRHDWLSDRWVIFAPNRTTRPDDYDRTPHIEPDAQLRCPFCRGAEHETPNASLILPGKDWESTRSTRRRDRSISSSDWLVRVVPNKFPAVACTPSSPDWADRGMHPVIEGHQPGACSGFLDNGCMTPSENSSSPLFIKQSATGAHEVIIESPQHVPSLTSLSTEHARWVFEAYRQRLAYWSARPEMKYAVLFKNYGADAGATLVHSHSQLIATSFVPSEVLRIQKRLLQYQESHHQCYICSVLERELASGDRVVTESDHFVAICPFASRFPYSVSIVPKKHQSRFEDCHQEELADLARVAQTMLKAIETEHPRCAYNFVLQTSHFDQQAPDSFHWRLKIIPRLSKVAGFEWSSDCYINTVFPEIAAQNLRQRIQVGTPLASPIAVAPVTNSVRKS